MGKKKRNLVKAGGPTKQELRQVKGLGAEEVMKIAKAGAEFQIKNRNNY